MAWKTPGVYFTEIDNTEFMNPAAAINTTVAIIGFAKKGPIGVPTEISTYNDYKTIFGTPISGQFAGLAIRNILTAGGTVLFTRIADTTIATKSNVVLKNGVDAIEGKIIINSNTDITTDVYGYELSSVYSGKLKAPSGAEKTLIIRAPAEGKLKNTNLFEQINDSLADTFGYDEYKLNNSQEISAASVRNFGLSVYNSSNSQYKNIGPFFVNINKGTFDAAYENITKVFDDGLKSNAYEKLYVLGQNSDGFVDWTEKTYSDYALDFGLNKTKTFNFTLTKVEDGIVTNTKKRIELTGDANASSDGYEMKLSDIAAELTTALSKDSVYVKYCFDVENKSAPYLLFVSLDTEVTRLDVNPYLDSDDNIVSTSLFVPVNPTSLSKDFWFNDNIAIDTIDQANQDYEFYVNSYIPLESDNSSDEDETFSFGSNLVNIRYTSADEIGYETGSLVSEFGGLFIAKKECVQVKEFAGDNNIASVELETRTKSLKFTAGDYFETAKGTILTVDKTEFGNFLFEDEDITDLYNTDKLNKDYVYLQNENSLNIGTHLAQFEGENGIDIQTEIEDGRIIIFEDGNEVPGEIDAESTIEGYDDLSVLIGHGMTQAAFDKAGYTVGSYRCYIYVDGEPAIDASKQDMIVWTAREYGEGTTNIGVKVYTSVSPIDASETHYISILVNGTIKETWEDVSYDPSAENYFADLINEEPENEGSAYVKCTVIKNNTSEVEVQMKDTEYYTENADMPVYLGKPLTENSIKRTSVGAKMTEYNKYDYSLGNNGVPEDSTDLFVEQMDTLESGLSNKDLYLWHILITPDNISEEVQDAAINLVEFMEDAIYIADPPQGLSRKNVVKWHNGKFGRGSAFESTYACTYWPWCKVYDSGEKKYVWAMPSVVMASQFCKVDNNYAPWYAPAGETNGLLTSVVDIEQYPNKNDRDNMYLDQNRVNPFLKLKNGNILAYGEKTFQRKNSVLTKIHTRRMLIALKHDIRNSIKHFLFLPTMAENIAKIRSIVTAIMEEVKIGGGVVSYNVICDESNNTTETLQQDILNIGISCVPTGCIEQVEVTFTLNKGTESVS